jgi:hypothetical protein
VPIYLPRFHPALKTIESLPNSRALNGLSKHKVVMLKVRYQGGNQVRVREFELKLSAFS